MHKTLKKDALQKESVKILIADDSVVSRHLLDTTLRKWGYQVVAVSDGLAAWNELQKEDAPALAVLDWVMPGLTGPEVCRLVRQQAAERYTYLIVLTSKSLREDLIEGMEAGADDYVTKPFDQHELLVRLRAGTRILELQSQLLKAREELTVQATRDPLTMLWNRSAIFDCLHREISRLERENTPLGVVMLDIDHFKSINDTYGHLAGDELLRQTAQRLRSAVRLYDSAGRYGGEEFLILLPGCSGDYLEAHAERVRAAFSDEPMRIGQIEIPITASIGATFALPSHHPQPEGLIRAADDALYQAKREGRDRCRFAAYESYQRSSPASILGELTGSLR